MALPSRGSAPQAAYRYVLYCRVFEALLPARTVLHSAGKMALDQFCHVPLLFLPERTEPES